jgi:hypothetical protein
MTPPEAAVVELNLQKLRQRKMCFDLMADFFDRAVEEQNEAAMQGAYNAMISIHLGDIRP